MNTTSATYYKFNACISRDLETNGYVVICTFVPRHDTHINHTKTIRYEFDKTIDWSKLLTIGEKVSYHKPGSSVATICKISSCELLFTFKNLGQFMSYVNDSDYIHIIVPINKTHDLIGRLIRTQQPKSTSLWVLDHTVIKETKHEEKTLISFSFFDMNSGERKSLFGMYTFDANVIENLKTIPYAEGICKNGIYTQPKMLIIKRINYLEFIWTSNNAKRESFTIQVDLVRSNNFLETKAL